MTQVQIYSDESYHSRIFRVKPSDDRVPDLYLPVEVPEDRIAEYEAAVQHELDLRRAIVADFGESQVNPYYHEQWDLYMAETAEPEPDDATVADDDPWAYYIDTLGQPNEAG